MLRKQRILERIFWVSLSSVFHLHVDKFVHSKSAVLVQKQAVYFPYATGPGQALRAPSPPQGAIVSPFPSRKILDFKKKKGLQVAM